MRAHTACLSPCKKPHAPPREVLLRVLARIHLLNTGHSPNIHEAPLLNRMNPPERQRAPCLCTPWRVLLFSLFCLLSGIKCVFLLLIFTDSSPASGIPDFFFSLFVWFLFRLFFLLRLSFWVNRTLNCLFIVFFGFYSNSIL